MVGIVVRWSGGRRRRRRRRRRERIGFELRTNGEGVRGLRMGIGFGLDWIGLVIGLVWGLVW